MLTAPLAAGAHGMRPTARELVAAETEQDPTRVPLLGWRIQDR